MPPRSPSRRREVCPAHQNVPTAAILTRSAAHGALRDGPNSRPRPPGLLVGGRNRRGRVTTGAMPSSVGRAATRSGDDDRPGQRRWNRRSAPSAARSCAVTSGAPSRLSTARCGHRRGFAWAHAGDEGVEIGELAGVPWRAAGEQPASQRGRVGAHPDQPDGRPAELVGPLRPARRVVDRRGERAGDQHGAAVGADLPGDGGEPGVLVHLDVRVVPVALALAGGPPGRGERRGDEPAVHGVLVQQRGHRVEQGEQPLGHRGLARPRRPRHDPHVRAHAPSLPHAPHPRRTSHPSVHFAPRRRGAK